MHERRHVGTHARHGIEKTVRQLMADDLAEEAFRIKALALRKDEVPR